MFNIKAYRDTKVFNHQELRIILQVPTKRTHIIRLPKVVFVPGSRLLCGKCACQDAVNSVLFMASK